LLYSENINPDAKGKIIGTLLKLKNDGLEEQTVKVVGFYLNHLTVNVDLESPERVKEFIANKNVNSGFKGARGCNSMPPIFPHLSLVGRSYCRYYEVLRERTRNYG
jgi:hypothetical protein